MKDFMSNFIPQNLTQTLILTIGFLGQIFFAGRIFLQWILSERAKKVVSPLMFWVFSIAGSYLFFIYGWLRQDFAIIFGQFISYYIYLWNLKAQGVWIKLASVVRYILILTPIAAIFGLILSGASITDTLFRNDSIPMLLLLYGSLGQAIFTFRFIYQMLYSAKLKESVLPLGFWWLSLIGSTIIITYGIIRADLVLIIGQAGGWIVYIRNICIELQYRKQQVK